MKGNRQGQAVLTQSVSRKALAAGSSVQMTVATAVVFGTILQ